MNLLMNERISRLFAIFILFILIAVLYTYPLAFNLSVMLPGWGQSDTVLSVWNIWNLKESLLTRHNLLSFTADSIFWPQKPSLILHNYTITTGLMSLPLQLFFTPLKSRNLLLFLQFALTGIGMYLLILYYTGNRIAALWAGITLAFCPYVMIRGYNYLHFSTVWYFPWFIYFFRRFLDRGNLRFALAAALICGLCLLDDQTYFIFLAVLGLFMLTGFLLGGRNKWNGTYTRSSLLGILVFLALTLPYLKGLFGQAFAAKGSFQLWNDACLDYFSLHGRNLLRPSPDLSLYRNLLFVPLPVEHVTNVFAGYIPLCLAIFALFNFRQFSPEKKRIMVFWLITGLIFFLLARGPFLLGKNQIPARFSLYNLLCSGILRQLRIPVRFSLITLIAIYILGAFGAARWLGLNKGRIMNNLGLGFLLITVQVVEFLPLPYPLLNLKVPAVYYRLAATDIDSPILVLPLGWQSSYRTVGAYDKKIQFYQTVHGHPIFQGQIARLENSYFDYYLSQPAFRCLVEAQDKYPAAKDRPAVYSLLDKYAIRNVVIHAAYFNKRRLDGWLKLFRDYPGRINVEIAP